MLLLLKVCEQYFASLQEVDCREMLGCKGKFWPVLQTLKRAIALHITCKGSFVVTVCLVQEQRFQSPVRPQCSCKLAPCSTHWSGLVSVISMAAAVLSAVRTASQTALPAMPHWESAPHSAGWPDNTVGGRPVISEYTRRLLGRLPPISPDQ